MEQDIGSIFDNTRNSQSLKRAMVIVGRRVFVGTLKNNRQTGFLRGRRRTMNWHLSYSEKENSSRITYHLKIMINHWCHQNSGFTTVPVHQLGQLASEHYRHEFVVRKNPTTLVFFARHVSQFCHTQRSCY